LKTIEDIGKKETIFYADMILEDHFIEKIQNIAKKYKVGIIYGYPERVVEDSKVLYYNSAMFLDDFGNILLNYRKAHLYDPENIYEKIVFCKGMELPPIVKFKDLKIGVLICFDIEFPEPARIMALRGAEIIVVPTANTDDFVCNITVLSRARENHIFLVYVNYVGTVGQLKFCGLSSIIAPDGTQLNKANSSDCQLITCSILPDTIKYIEMRQREAWSTERRAELYHELTQINPI